MESQTITENIYLDKIIMENTNSFQCLVIKQGSIESVDWSLPNYSEKLMELDLFESVTANQDNFIEILATKLDVNQFKVTNLGVTTQIVAEEPYYLYELLYVNLEKETQYHLPEKLNQMASLININGEKVYSNAILIRSHLPSLTDSMTMCNLTKNDLACVLHRRVHTQIAIWNNLDNIWTQDTVIGDLNNYAQTFFECDSPDDYKKIEFPFLMHNVNIWYTESLDGLSNACGKFINAKFDKCIMFTMKSDDYRGNLTLDEVKKMIFLSNVLDSYLTPSELLEEKNDKLGRKIIYNKYKVLDYVYNQYNKIQ